MVNMLALSLFRKSLKRLKKHQKNIALVHSCNCT
jgi:hypothetical protein